jgi:hypothetical protein
MKDGLTPIGPLHREQHFHLNAQHRCYFWGEYTSWNHTRGKNADFSETNRLIADLKTPRELKDNAQEWTRKSAAIDRVSEAFGRFWRWSELADKALLVPMPTSKARADPLRDDRMDRVVEGIKTQTGLPLACAPLLMSDGSLEPSHSAAARPKLRRLVSSMSVESAAIPTQAPTMVFLFDDVLTTGAHFVASSTHLQRVFPQARIIGTFVARTRRPDPQE